VHPDFIRRRDEPYRHAAPTGTQKNTSGLSWTRDTSSTKTEKRSYQTARDELHRSLDLLQTDHIDLWQMHILVDPAEWETAMGPGGALEAFIEARQQGLVRFLGVTGHGTTIAKMHLRSLERFDFDSVMLPYNYPMMQNPQYAADFEKLAAVCQAKNVAIQTIKSICRGPWGEKPRIYATWYEPLDEQEEINQAVAFVLQRPGLFLSTVGDIGLLPRVVEAAKQAETQENVEAALARLDLAPLFV
jgi:predicted aldo/keto reductase-like oxidoreductase